MPPTVAFERLRHHARSRNLRLTDLARQIVDKELDLGEVLAAL